MPVYERPGQRKPYLVQFYDEDGKRKAEAYASRTDAEARDAHVKACKAAGRPIPARAEEPVAPTPVPEEPVEFSFTVTAAIESIGARMRSGEVRTKKGTKYREQTLTNLESVLRLYVEPHVGRVPVDQVGRKHVVEMRRRVYADTGSEARAKAAVDALRSLYRHLVDDEVVDINPCAGLPAWHVVRRAERILEPEEIGVLMREAQAHRNPRIEVFITMALLTGARRGEIEAATWGPGSVDLGAGTWAINKNRTRSGSVGPTKTGKTRTIPLGPALLSTLRAYRMKMGRPSDGEPVVGPLPEGAWHEVREAVGEPVMIIHDLRGTAASLMLANGISVIAVAEHLGHDPKVLLATYAAAMRQESSQVAGVLEGAALGQGRAGLEVV